MWYMRDNTSAAGLFSRENASVAIVFIAKRIDVVHIFVACNWRKEIVRPKMSMSLGILNAVYLNFQNTAEKLSLICRQGDIFFILYSITDRASFEEAKRIGRFIKDSPNGDSVAMVIVANKCDLEHFRRVKFEEGNDLSTELNCAFHEVTTSEDNKQVREVVQSSVSSYLRHREKMKESGNLKVPSFVKRTPSFEKSDKKKRSSRNSQESLKTPSRPFEIHPRMRRKEEGDGSDDKTNNNNNNSRVSYVYRKQNENSNDTSSSSKRMNGDVGKNRTHGPFNVEKVKTASQSRDRQKLPSPTGKAAESCNDEKPKMPFTVHKVKGSSASEWMRPLPVDKVRAPTSRYPTEQSVSEEKPKHSSKGPFSLDRLRSQSTEKLRASSSNDRSTKSTSSFTRMKDGLIGRTKALRRKPIYL